MGGKIRLLFVLGSMHNGGTEVFVMNFFRELDKSKYDISFLVVQGDEEYFREEIERSGAHFYHLSSSTDGKYRNNIKEIRAFFESHKYDIVHIHSCSIRFMLLIAYDVKKYHAGLTIGHAHSVGEPTGSLVDRAVRNIIKIILSYTLDYGMACSSDSAEAKYTKSFIASKKYRMIPNAIDINKYLFSQKKRDEIREELSLKEKYVVGIIGRLEKWKNQSFLIDAVAIANRAKEVHLLIIGDGDIRSELEEKVNDLMLSDKVIFAGAVDNTYDYYSAMDLFCLPSYAEGFPFVLVEAQANGLKCLISNTTTMETDISNSSEYISIDDANLWAERILYNKNSRLTEELVDLVKQQYDIRYAAKTLQSFYEEAIKKIKE